MSITVHRLDTRFYPDPKRVMARFFFPGPESRVKKIIKKVVEIDDDEAKLTLNQALRDFSDRHRNISKIYRRHFENVIHFVKDLGYNPEEIPEFKQLLIGAFFTNEYSIESAAFFNPSMVEDPDQTNLLEGQRRVIVSFRATGEGHISSIVFRGGIVNKDGTISFQESNRLVDEAEFIHSSAYNKKELSIKLNDLNLLPEITQLVIDKLPDQFDFNQLTAIIKDLQLQFSEDQAKIDMLESVIWLAGSDYKISFSLDTSISDRVIFPISASESNGIEDARFVKFTDNAGEVTYYGTYTAYNGRTILPKLIETKDFYHFNVMPLHGNSAYNKGMALFPRKIKGQYVMVGRIDGINNYIMFSDEVNIWQEAKLLQEPKYAWECVQIGNSGSPIETEKGWLLLTHGVGTMRQYSLGAVLLDLEDPSKIIARLEEPLLVPNAEEREGYVPNVVYTCGAIKHDDKIIIPYAMSDTASTVAYIYLKDLFEKMIPEDGVDLNQDVAHVLLVEDDLINQKIIKAVLKERNYKVTSAGDGVNALMEIAKGHFDVVLSDINMPNFDGFQLLEYMQEKKIDIPVIFLTGLKDESLELKSLRMGAVDYIKKPVDRELLLLKLKKILGF
ncbi:MAG: glycosidase [Bacteroidetes bacterium 4572_77]|nr:MAG: glycosidase [Bacteroidetes bacterium 4572_77]